MLALMNLILTLFDLLGVLQKVEKLHSCRKPTRVILCAVSEVTFKEA